MRQSYQDLEYAVLTSQIASRCHSSLGAALAAELKPLDDLSAIKAELVLNSQAQEALKRGIEPQLADLSDPAPLYEDGAQLVFGYEEFFLFYQNAVISCLTSAYRDAAEDLPSLISLIKRVHPLPQVRDRFLAIFDAEGEVKDSASSELTRIRKRANSLRGSIMKTMNGLLADQGMQAHLQDKFFTQREDRYVLPVRESSVNRVPGIVQSHSGSRSTIFIEPQSVVPLNNELQLIKQDEKKEIYRIFSEFSQDIRDLKDVFVANTKALARLDLLFAWARLGNQIKAELPSLSPDPVLELSGARHPLLSLKLGHHQVIPFDLTIGDEKRVLVLSGPNTGGKTVLMKAVGLITLMTLTGLPTPLSPQSRIGMFDKVFADIGDDQSIESALSTFSSHVAKIRAMLEGATPRSLVLIDEIGAATDPQQGSGLAQAMLERFVELGCRCVVTTHYTALKIFAESEAAALNASMQFDLAGMTPTYRFAPGFPGDSFAIEVAASLGLEPSLIERAKSLSGSQNREFTELLRKMQEEKKALARESYEYRLKNRNLEARLGELDTRSASLDEELKARKQKFLKELQMELISRQKLYQKELSELKDLDKAQRKSLSEKKLKETESELGSLSNQIMEAAKAGRKAAFDPKPGDRVWLANFESDAIILERRDGQVLVDMNGISFKTPLDTVFEGSQPLPDQELIGSASVRGKASAPARVSTELKLLGCTFDEAQPLIDEFIDTAIVAGLHRLRIVHGKGTGVLRSKTRDYLRRKKQVISIDTPPPSEGGSGVTVVSI
ncbi:MAG TPA: Smr/MutS family protein [Candidatus Cloacimonadota bacterium]|nr:Smr/MutS family protein [Candidatus Cloacimonadota bacterium]